MTRIPQGSFRLRYEARAQAIEDERDTRWFDDDGKLLAPKARAPVNDRKILPSEVEAVIAYRRLHPDIGYRKLACEILNEYAYEYNHQRLHAGIHYLRPADMFFRRGHVVLSERDRRLEIARANRKKHNRATETCGYY